MVCYVYEKKGGCICGGQKKDPPLEKEMQSIREGQRNTRTKNTYMPPSLPPSRSFPPSGLPEERPILSPCQ